MRDGDVPGRIVDPELGVALDGSRAADVVVAGAGFNGKEFTLDEK